MARRVKTPKTYRIVPIIPELDEEKQKQLQQEALMTFCAIQKNGGEKENSKKSAEQDHK